MRGFTAAAVQVQPLHAPLTRDSIAANVEHCVDFVQRCVADTSAQLVVLPETCTTGFTPGLGPEELWDIVGTFRTPVPVRVPMKAPATSLPLFMLSPPSSASTWSTAGTSADRNAESSTTRPCSSAPTAARSGSTARPIPSAPRSGPAGGG